MSYDDDYDDGDDDQASVSGPGALGAGFSSWPSLNQRAGHWSETLKRDQTKPKTPVSPANREGQDEIRWGDRRTRNITVLAGQTGLIGLNPDFDQVVQLRRPARVWSLIYNLEFTNPVQSPLIAGEDILAFFSIYLGIGSSRIRIARDINIPGPTGTPIFRQFGIDASITDANLAAAEIVISVNAAVNVPVAPVANRTFNLILSAHAAPVTR
jgi:hypothetical protein